MYWLCACVHTHVCVRVRTRVVFAMSFILENKQLFCLMPWKMQVRCTACGLHLGTQHLLSLLDAAWRRCVPSLPGAVRLEPVVCGSIEVTAAAGGNIRLHAP